MKTILVILAIVALLVILALVALLYLATPRNWPMTAGTIKAKIR